MAFIRNLIEYLWLPITVLCVWLAACHLGWNNPLLLPSPQAVLDATLAMIASGELIRHIAASVSRTISGFAISTILALTLAWIFSHHRQAERQGHIVLEAVRVVPPLSLVPLLILWLGIGESPKIAIVILASFFPIYLSTFSGFQNVDKKWDELAVSLNLTKREKLLHISLPAALPAVLTGLRLGFGYSWRALVGAELIAASSGLGYLIQDSAEMSRPDLMLVGIFCIAFLGILMDWIFAALAKHFVIYSRTISQY